MMANVPQPVMNRVFIEAAAAYWNAGPKCGAPKLVYVDGAPQNDDWVQPDSWAFVMPDGVYDCKIFLVANWWEKEREDVSPRLYCNLLTHEYGHLLGIWDDNSHNTIRSHTIHWWTPDKPCKRDVRFLRQAY